MLSNDELHAWAQQVRRALFDFEITKVEDAALIRSLVLRNRNV